MKLYPYQKTHVENLLRILKTKRGALDRSATGTGKTICALSIAKKLGAPAAVVCPLGVIPSWVRTAEALSVPLHVVNYESLTKHARGFLTENGVNIPTDALVIYDEAHRCKNHKTGNAKNMLRLAQGRKILALSATIAHHAEHLRTLNEILRFTNAGSFSGFMDECGYYWQRSHWGGGWMPVTEARALARTAAVIAPFSAGMTIEDAAALFKENSVSVEIISSKDDKALEKIYRETFQALSRKDKAGRLTKMLRARQASEAAKLPYVVEQTEELVEQGFSVVVFCNFNTTVDTLRKHFKRAAVIRGGQNPAGREFERRAFQENKVPVMLCNIQSGGVGLDLHDLHGKPRRSIVLPSWSAVDLKQALGRIHRAGARSNAQQTILYSDVPVERRIAEVVRAKLHNLAVLNNSDVDAAFSEKVLTNGIKGHQVKKRAGK